ncbi:hypothetical protein [Flavobacterium sp. fv08]|uniref:hypothetical protein n=1 Tax=Flavobacterium sp. fv08 TaxID=1761784 RepID=UPI0008D2363E|nr:hypothetical protein [Flavobacterium sp. fv08]SEP06546.1 hypothetical protein SAMN04487978_4364 [Flavobacterium sp. fv08]
MNQFSDLKNFVVNNHIEVSAIMEAERLKINNAAEIKILHAKFLTNFWKDRPNKSISYVIYFKEDCIQTLNFGKISENLALVTEALKTNNILAVNSDFEIIEKCFQNITESFLLDYSNNQHVVFFFGEEGIDTVIRGKIIDKINIFYNESDRLQYLKKYHISKLQECIKEYEIFVREPGNNDAFFASMSLIKQLKAENPPKNTLKNKPEKILRDNLLSFLNRNTQHTFSKENELNNMRELDLYAEVEGKKYLIEVKWLGQSINDDDTAFTQKMTDIAARKGVTQTLEYIQELIENMRYNVHCGYLCVFDVREDKRAVNYDGYNFIPDQLKPYYTNHFIKLDEISLDRN